MRWASLRYAPGAEQVTPRRRVVALGFVAAVHILLLLMLLTLAPPVSPKLDEPKTSSTFELMPDRRESPAPSKAKRAEEKASAARPKAATVAKAPVPKVAPPVLPPNPNSTALPGVIPLTRDELAAADIATMPSRDRGAGDAAGETAAVGGSGKGNGKGPGGADLYNAEWQREPTDAELAFYLPKTIMRPAWAIIVCRTVANYRVEDCREIGQYPSGSGLASAVRQAAWQFRVLPPRAGGRPLIGAWVSIRMDFTEKGIR